MSHFKQKHKEYLVKNGIKTEDDLVIYLDILRNTRNSSKEDRQMLMDFAWLMINEKSSVSSFFAENLKETIEDLFKPTPSKAFYDAFEKHTKEEKKQLVRANFYRYTDDNKPMVIVVEFSSLEDAKEYFKNSPYTEVFYYVYGTDELIEKEEKSKPFFMDEVLEAPKVRYKESSPTDRDISNVYAVIYQYNTDCESGSFKYNLPKEVDESYKTVFDPNGQGVETLVTEKIGKKEKTGKLHYELSWEFIEEMAKRMANNKSDKYPLYNWKKDIDVQDLKDAINRHHIEVMKGNYQDGDEILGHIVQYACNSMMLWEQLRKKVK